MIRDPDLCLFNPFKNELQCFLIRQVFRGLLSISLIHPLRGFFFLLLFQLPIAFIHLEQSPVRHHVFAHLCSPCLYLQSTFVLTPFSSEQEVPHTSLPAAREETPCSPHHLRAASPLLLHRAIPYPHPAS